MTRSTWPQLRRKIDRLRKLTDAPALISRTGFAVGTTEIGHVTIKPGDLNMVEEIKDDYENLYIWLWNIKDHVITMLTNIGTPAQVAKRMVHDYIDKNPDLKIVADVANTAKHASLRQSKSGQFARIGNYVTTAPILMPWQNGKLAQQRIRQESSASITIENDKGEAIGDAEKIALSAAQAWERFVSQYGCQC